MTTQNEIEFVINDKFKEFFFDQKPYILLSGGAGSGKSFAASQKILLRTLNEDDNRTLVLMQTASRLRSYVFQTFLDVIDTYHLRDLFECRVSPLEIICKSNGNKIVFFGLDDNAEQLKSIPGIKNIFIEECTSISKRSMEQINIRLRGQYKYYKQIILACNPIDKSSWVYKDFVQEAKYSPAGIYNSTFRDNPYVGEDYEYRLRDSYDYDENLLGVYYNGEWGERSSQKIFTNWRVDETISQDFSSYRYSYGGGDIGFNDPNVLLCVGFIEDKVYIFKEFYKRHITNQQFVSEIKKIVPRGILSIIDARAAGSIQEMKNSGIYCRPSDKTPNSIIAGINFLKSKEIIIHPSCKNTIDEMTQYSYLFDEEKNSFIDKPTVGNEHCIDACRYACDPQRLRKIVRAGIKIF